MLAAVARKDLPTAVASGSRHRKAKTAGLYNGRHAAIANMLGKGCLGQRFR